jgi:hypothetical protein
MSIPVSSPGLKPAQDAPRVKEQGGPSATALQARAKEAPTQASATAQARANQNSAIVQASLSVAISSGNEPLALLYKSAITSINEELKADFGDDAIQNAAGLDNSPEATAERIVSLSTAFYEAYRQQRPGADEAATRSAFVDTIRSGVERGFEEAREILSALKVLQGDVAGNIERTYELVQKGLDAFAEAPQAT